MPDADLIPPFKPPVSNPEAAPQPLPDALPTDPETESEADFEPFDASAYSAFSAPDAPETEVEVEVEAPETERVSKLIAKAGLASRRAAEEMIAAGRVTLNGHVISEQGVKADVLNDRIVVDGHPLRISEKPGVVLVFHKPRLVMTTKDDPGGRSTVMDFLPRKWQSLHPVGRLDFDTSGVLLLTDDGELTHLLTHPSHGAEKVYEARVRGVVEAAAIEKLERGVRLDDGPTAPCRAKLMAQRDKNALVQLVLREGRNRQVRRMLEAVGHPANALRRISFAGVELEGLPAGEFRILLPVEVKALRKRVESKVKKLSDPKGKFHKRKIPKIEAQKTPADPEVVPFKVPHKRLERAAIAKQESEEKRGVRPSAKNSTKPAVPKRDAKPDSRPAPRRPRNAPDLPQAPKLERKGSKARALSDAQKNNKPAPRAKKAEETPKAAAPRRAPVASRVEKRWKS